MKVLYIDDSPMQLKIVSIYLGSNAGFQIVPASSGKEGIDKAKTEAPDVILLDMEMPDMDGETALRILKAQPLTADIPVIMFTSSPEPGLEARLKSLGAAAFLKKPHGISTLTSTIVGLAVPAGDDRAQ